MSCLSHFSKQLTSIEMDEGYCKKLRSQLCRQSKRPRRPKPRALSIESLLPSTEGRGDSRCPHLTCPPACTGRGISVTCEDVEKISARDFPMADVYYWQCSMYYTYYGYTYYGYTYYGHAHHGHAHGGHAHHGHAHRGHVCHDHASMTLDGE